ncbi:hypothetical protein IFM89_012020 [Coptis chinensis]|uniref:RING-type E3 ubiquitin transferase n=1 Tax=Coptis chinensis TaxID=261450 RepID=A0A835IZW5_9MAGN|nr:hypothetical protein IFM89_012020 [Coptis chinensis]
MNRKLDHSERRILTFSAIHPCQNIAPMTLVASLISLARNICAYRPKFFVTHKRNIREIIRQVGILLIFLEEIHERKSVLPHSLVVCFFELHLAFQKLGYLLEDCTREGARLWILIKCRRISAELQVLINAVATSLDVLPLNSLDVSVEVKELIELVAKQAQRAKFEVDPDDERTMADVASSLMKFENKIAPDPLQLQGVINYLEIRSWSECNKEIKFLDEEISIGSLNGEEKEVALLSSLMGFVCYCRGVVFDATDNRSMDRTDSRYEGEDLSCLNPEDFRCPISLEIMMDPVTIATGQTYERSSIQKWLKAGNHTCPKTGEKLTSTALVPNSALQNVIRQYCSNSGILIAEPGHKSRDITRTIYAGSPAAAGAMRLLAEYLTYRLAVGTSEDKNKAANDIRLLAKSSIFNRSCFLEAGTIPYLLHLLCSMDSNSQENAIAALLNLSKHSKSKEVIVENGGAVLIVDVLAHGLKMESRQLAAASLFYLSSVEEYRQLIGEIPEAIEALVALIREGTPRGKKNAVVAIFGLILFHENHRRVLEAGVVPLLVDILAGSERTDLVTDSLAVLASLVESHDGTMAILCNSALAVLIEILHSSTSRTAKEYCVSILLSLCINGGLEVVSLLHKNSSLMASLYSLLMEGSSRASKKSSTILSILHEFNNRNSSGMSSLAREQERYVQVRNDGCPGIFSPTLIYSATAVVERFTVIECYVHVIFPTIQGLVPEK